MVYKKKPLTASEIIHRKYKGQRNFMTPNKLQVGKINKNVAFELSSGSGLGSGRTLYGVTVVSANPKTQKVTSLYDRSKAFESENKAKAYIDRLKLKMKLKAKMKK